MKRVIYFCIFILVIFQFHNHFYNKNWIKDYRSEVTNCSEFKNNIEQAGFNIQHKAYLEKIGEVSFEKYIFYKEKLKYIHFEFTEDSMQKLYDPLVFTIDNISTDKPYIFYSDNIQLISEDYLEKYSMLEFKTKDDGNRGWISFFVTPDSKYQEAKGSLILEYQKYFWRDEF